MKVELFYFDGCPNWTVADQRLSEALTRRDSNVTVERRRVTNVLTQADEVGFTGSPTIRIDDRDPFASGEEQVGSGPAGDATPTGGWGRDRAATGGGAVLKRSAFVRMAPGPGS